MLRHLVQANIRKKLPAKRKLVSDAAPIRPSRPIDQSNMVMVMTTLSARVAIHSISNQMMSGGGRSSNSRYFSPNNRPLPGSSLVSKYCS